MMEIGTLTLHRYNGDEIYAVSSAKIGTYEGEYENEIFVSFDVETDKTPLKISTDAEEPYHHPSAEWNLALPEFNLPAMVGNIYSILNGDNDGEWLARLYYFEHEPIDDNVIEVLAYDGNYLTVRITGTAVDVNIYDGPVPPTTVVLEARFPVKE
jgi:hypothetical protein